MSFQSIQWRLTAALALIALLVFAAAGSVLSLTLDGELTRAELTEVQGRAEQVQLLLAESRDSGITAAFHRQIEGMLLGHGDLLVSIEAADGRLLFSNSSDPLRMMAADTASMIGLQDGRRVAGTRVRLQQPGALDGAVLTVAMATSMRGDILRGYRLTLAWICGTGVAATAGLAAWATRAGLRPVRLLADHAMRVSPEQPALRLPVDGIGSELRPLSHAFNDALDRLQQAYGRLEAFNADVAHELRTPLATLISGTEITLSQPRTKDELEQLHGAHLEQLHRMRAIVNDMLFLARADVGEQAADQQVVSLAAEAAKVIEYHEGVAAERGVQVVLRGDAQVRCNAGLVRRALSNLLSNALKHASGAEPVVIAVEASDGPCVWLGATNHGPTIPADVLPHIFDRFYRADAARSGSEDSHGLGLAIVQAVAKMHGGSVDAASKQGITRVGLRLPN